MQVCTDRKASVSQAHNDRCGSSHWTSHPRSTVSLPELCCSQKGILHEEAKHQCSTNLDTQDEVLQDRQETGEICTDVCHILEKQCAELR